MPLDQLQPYAPVAAGLLGVTASGLGVAYKWSVGRHRRRIARLSDQLATAEKLNAELSGKLADATAERNAARLAADRVAPLAAAHDALAADYAAARDAIAGHEKSATTQRNRVRKALALEGAIWTQPVMAGTRPFRPLDDRRTPVVSVLNLKGGVGKTTLTAYLGWAMAARGYRVLLVDLDLQGSLSSLFVPNGELAGMERDGRLLRHYLDAPKGKLLDLAVPLPQYNPRSRLVATTDRLGYSELGQTFQWLLRVGQPTRQWTGRQDARMLLRRALHAKGLANRFDLVLLDCPPLVNLCCANALAASDFVLVPVTPSVKAIERVPALMRRVKEVRDEGVNPALRVVGVVANRTQEKDLTPRERDLLKDLPRRCHDVLHDDVPVFDTHVPQRTYYRDNEDAFAPPPDDSPAGRVFPVLAEEFAKRLPSTCRRPKAVRPPAAGLFGGVA